MTRPMASGVYGIREHRVPHDVCRDEHDADRRLSRAGRPEATAAIERAMDLLAAEIGMDPADVAEEPDPTVQDPHTTTIDQTYDFGDYVGALDRASAPSATPTARRAGTSAPVG